MWNLFKVKNKDSRTTSMTFVLEYLLLTLKGFTHCSGVSIVYFEEVNAGWGLFICFVNLSMSYNWTLLRLSAQLLSLITIVSYLLLIFFIILFLIVDIVLSTILLSSNKTWLPSSGKARSWRRIFCDFISWHFVSF